MDKQETDQHEKELEEVRRKIQQVKERDFGEGHPIDPEKNQDGDQESEPSNPSPILPNKPT
ncbi:MAG: hypothetical protein E6J02_11705 [Chloroflexi bacterium]|nr:MAG: hypothetical protein E6J02_11705 [Chloroflexota bacterium]